MCCFVPTQININGTVSVTFRPAQLSWARCRNLHFSDVHGRPKSWLFVTIKSYANAAN